MTTDDVVNALERRVEERRAAGDYPPDLEERLERHFRRIIERRPAPYDASALEARLRAVDDALAFSPERIPYESGVPGGPALHRTVGRAVGRQTAGVLAQVSEFADAVRDALRELATAMQHPQGHHHADLVATLDAVLDRLASYERADALGPGVAGELLRRVEALEEADRRRRFRPFFDPQRFANEFRGSRADLLARYVDLADRLADSAPVADLGCGRGELVELLAERGAAVIGVERDAKLAAACIDAGLPVVQDEGLGWLQTNEPESLGAIVLVQVVEHLSPQELLDVVLDARRVLRTGGILAIETINPASLVVHTSSLVLDPTHGRPVHPAYLTFVLREAGFTDVELTWRSPVEDESALETAGDGASQANVAKLNKLLFGPQDYLVTARR